MSKKIFLAVLIIVFGALYAQAIEVKIITDPKPTCTEPPGEELKLDFKLNMDIDDENFVAKPGSLAVDKSGNIFVFDRLQATIFKFNKEGKFLKKFGRQGRGPGEFSTTGSMSNVILNIQEENKILTFDRAQRMLNIFGLEGKLINSIKLKYNRSFIPVMDKDGNIYAPSVHDGVIDVLNNKKEYQQPILDQAILREFLFLEPMPSYKRRNIFPSTNIHFFFVAEKKLLVYSDNTSLVCLVKNGKIEKKFYLWPEKTLQLYKKTLESIIKNCKDGYQCHQALAVSVFPDLDDSQFFYIQFSSQTDKKRMELFKFDLNGKLFKMFFVKKRNDGHPKFLIKRNNRFYVKENEHTFLYKENKK